MQILKLLGTSNGGSIRWKLILTYSPRINGEILNNLDLSIFCIQGLFQKKAKPILKLAKS